MKANVPELCIAAHLREPSFTPAIVGGGWTDSASLLILALMPGSTADSHIPTDIWRRGQNIWNCVRSKVTEGGGI